MSYTTFAYLLLLGGTVLGYYIFPRKIRWVALLAANMVFYYQAGWQELLILIVTAAITWYASLHIGEYAAKIKNARKDGLTKEEKNLLKSKKGRWVWLSNGASLIILAVCKYTNFTISIVTRILPVGDPGVIRMVVPLGLSFYTFMMVAYTLDVSKGKVPAQKNFFKYLLYISFFPTVVQGPINRYKEVGGQIMEGHSFRFENIRDGAILVLWGFAKKLIISERLALFVSQIYDNYSDYNGLIILIAAMVFSVQIYADFDGCMNIAAGSARMLGIEIPANFLRPYFSRTLPEFWRRWHITMGSFFRDYVFFPFSISKMSQKANKAARARFGDGAGRIVAAALPILIVWFLTGLWHGAETKYICWGLFHGILIMLSTICGPGLQSFGERIHLPSESFLWRVVQMLRTFLLCAIGRIFFRAGSVGAAFGMLRNLFSGLGLEHITGGKLLTYGLDGKNSLVAWIFVAIWFIVSVLEERGINVLDKLTKSNIVIRWALLYVLLLSVFVFGKYGPGYDVAAFIYEKF